jgi:glycerol transport system permease protein
MKKRYLALSLYFVLLFVPIYWMVVTSLKTDGEILHQFTLFPKKFTLDNYIEIFTSDVWRSSYLNSLIYVFINVFITLIAAVPGAYAFSRWKFRGDHHLFFWLLTNRMAPAAVFILELN